MNHPKPEEWVPYVCGEATLESRRELQTHLRDCAECREQVDQWKHSLHRLDAWKLPKVNRLRGFLLPSLKFAAAATVVLLAGIMIGRATAPTVDAQRLRQAITPEIRRELSAELTQVAREEAARAASLGLATGRRYTDQVAQQLYVAVKKDIDTVAFNTEAGLRHTAQQLVQLADYSQPETPVNQNP